MLNLLICEVLQQNELNFRVFKWVWHTMIDRITPIQMLTMQAVQTLPYVALKRLVSIALSHFHLYQYVLNNEG